MQVLKIIQWGKNRSVVEVFYSETNEKKFMIIDNDYLMMLDDLGCVL